MKLTVLGCSGAYPTRYSGTTSYLIESNGYHLLLDSGSGTFRELRNHINPFELDACLITHYHYDHIGDLGVLQYYLQLNANKQNNFQELPIYGHNLDATHFDNLTFLNITKGIAYHEDEELDLGPSSITFCKTIHPVPTFAVRIVEKATGKVLVFTADSGYLEKLIDFARDADLFLADTYFLNGYEKHHAHLTAGETGYIAKMAGAKRVVLTHLQENTDYEKLIDQTKETFNKDTVSLAKTGKVYEL